MSDKDEPVEMSEEVAAGDSSADDNDEEEMGQLKSKIKKLKGKKKEAPEEEEHEEEEEDDFEYDQESDGKDFMCGVVEGFYGRPWTTGQRKELFRRMKAMGMNTYLYGPKDDYKHRLYWRDLYSPDEADLLKLLIEAAEENDVLFIYAISPGLDMAFAAPKEVEALKNKLLQVQGLGCKAYALLFDDIDPMLCASDKEEYKSAASAQASITNQMHELLDKPRFLFCPTEYCNSMAIPDVKNSQYLTTIGKELQKSIPIMWTGPKVVSKRITVESIRQLTKIVRRKVVIWDNIHANDYDPKRVFLGPYKGRSTDLIPHLAGVLTNPNCEFESNYIAMHTLSSWWKSFIKHAEEKALLAADDTADDTGKKSDVEMVSAESDAKKSDNEEEKETVTQKPTESEESNNAGSNDGTAIKGDLKEGGVTAEAERNEEVETKKVEGDEKKEESSEKQQHESQGDEDSSANRQEGNAASAMSSGVSSYAGSDDSDTDSDYSSHDEYYDPRRNSSPAFDHGMYDPEESLKEAIKSWLPLFSTSYSALGKPIPRSGPPLGMVPQFDLTLTSSVPMGQTSITTSVLNKDPILSAALPCYGSPDAPSPPKSQVEEKPEAPVSKHAAALENNASVTEPLICPSGTDVEMASATPGSPGESTPVPDEGKKDEKTADVDIDMGPAAGELERAKEENMQTGDVDDSGIKRSESSAQMDTEEEEAMQYDADQDSDVSMMTNNSNEEKKTSKEETDEKEAMASLSGSSMEMTSPPHLPSSVPQSPERESQATPERQDGETSDAGSGLFKIEFMSLEDVELAVELFYLPYEHGNMGRKMVQEFIWLQQNVHKAVAPPNAPKSVKNENLDKALEWMERAIHFEDSCIAIRRMCNKLTTCSNRALLYDLFPYFWDMKGVVSMLSSYIKWMGQFYLRHQHTKTPESSETNSNTSKPSSPEPPPPQHAHSPPSMPEKKTPQPQPPFPQPPAAMWLGSDPEPWVFRGGLSGEFQRLLPITMANDLFCQVIPCSPQSSNMTYVIRPYLPSDEKSLYSICLTTGNDGTDFADDFSTHQDLPGERLVGGLLTLSPEYCFVVEDEHGVCGYLVGTPDAKSFWKKYSITFLPEIKEKYSTSKVEEEEKLGDEVRKLLEEVRSEDPPDAYAVDSLHASHPAYMQIAVHRRVMDPSITKSMTVCLLSALKSHGVHGVHTTVRSSDCYMPDLYSRLGFHEIRPTDPPPLTPPASTLPAYKDEMIIVFGRTF